MSVGHPLRADGLHALRALQRPLTQCLRCRAPRQVEELWGAFDKDGSGEIVYHELLAALTPALAPAKPSLQTLDPHNSRADWRYSKRDWEGAGSLIERHSDVRAEAYSTQVKFHQADINAYMMEHGRFIPRCLHTTPPAPGLFRVTVSVFAPAAQLPGRLQSARGAWPLQSARGVWPIAHLRSQSCSHP